MASKKSSRRSRKRRRLRDKESQSLEPNYQEDLKTAFTTGNKEMTEQLLHDVGSTRQLTDVRINDTFLIASVVYIRSAFFYLRGEMMVSLLHLAAYWGWYDIAVRLWLPYTSARLSVRTWRDTFHCTMLPAQAILSW